MSPAGPPGAAILLPLLTPIQPCGHSSGHPVYTASAQPGGTCCVLCLVGDGCSTRVSSVPRRCGWWSVGSLVTMGMPSPSTCRLYLHTYTAPDNKLKTAAHRPSHSCRTPVCMYCPIARYVAFVVCISPTVSEARCNISLPYTLSSIVSEPRGPLLSSRCVPDISPCSSAGVSAALVTPEILISTFNKRQTPVPSRPVPSRPVPSRPVPSRPVPPVWSLFPVPVPFRSPTLPVPCGPLSRSVVSGRCLGSGEHRSEICIKKPRDNTTRGLGCETAMSTEWGHDDWMNISPPPKLQFCHLTGPVGLSVSDPGYMSKKKKKIDSLELINSIVKQTGVLTECKRLVPSRWSTVQPDSAEYLEVGLISSLLLCSLVSLNRYCSRR